MFGASLRTSAVRVQHVNANAEGVADASAEIEAVFRAKATDGHWRLSEVRTGQDTWERLDLIAQALGAKLPAGGCDAASQFVRIPSASTMTVKRARCLVAELLGVTLPSDQVRIKDLSSLDLPLGSESSALIESSIQVDFRLARDARGWRVSEFKSGNRDWTNLDSFSAALNDVKRASATSDLATIANALIDFRRRRGSFVVSDKESVLIDHLSPQYLTRVIRVDPWHRPYQYDGEQDRFSLRSLGPDGKPNTPDDIVVSGPTP
jgi:Type II secretion system (T2SS), protein G